MILMQLSPDTLTTPASALALIVAAGIKYFIFDAKKSKKDEKVDEQHTELLQNAVDGIRDMKTSIDRQIQVSEARREVTEKMVDMRHEENIERMGHICKYKGS